MTLVKALALSALALPLSAQAWDCRVEVPYPKGQNLPQTLIEGTGNLIQQGLSTGSGYLVTVNHRIIRVGPVLKLEWGVEYSRMQQDGQVQVASSQVGSNLRQYGLGLGVNAQFWLPFTGLAGEFGAIERFQAYQFSVANADHDENFARPWLRVGLRYSLPFAGLDPYVAASYQQPITKNSPVVVDSASNLLSYLAVQGTGQEFQRMWTFGVGITF